MNKRIIAIALISMCAGMTAGAAITQFADSSTFDYQYEMDTAPNNQNLDGVGGDDWWDVGVPTVSGGVAANTAQNQLYRGDFAGSIWRTLNTPAAADWTLEVRMRKTSAAASPAGWFGFATANLNESNSLRLNIEDDRVSFDSGYTGDAMIGTAFSNGWHTVRIAHDAVDNAHYIWVNGTLLNADLSTPIAGGNGTSFDNSIFIADFTGYTGDWEIDYIRLEKDGAYGPATGTPTSLKWAVGDGGWDTATSNWVPLAGGSATTYSDGDFVTLNDDASGTSPITISLTATRSPGSLAVSNVSKDYVLAGSDISGATGLTKLGAGSLTLEGANTYTGTTTVGEGTLVVTNGNAIADTVTVSVANGATFEVNDGETVAGLNSVAGSTVDVQSGTLTFTTGSILGDLTGSGTVLRNGTSDTASGQFTTTDALSFNGTLQLRGSTPSTSPSTMQGGTGRFWLHSTNGSQAVGTAFALDTGASGTDAQDVIIGDWDGNSGNRKLTLSSLTGYGTLRTDAGDTGTRQLIVDQSGGDTTFNGMLLSHTSGAGAVRSVAFEKKGSSKLTMAGIIGKETAASGPANADVAITVTAGTLELAAANTATGPIAVNGGTLALGAAGTIANVPTITVASGGVFEVSATSFTLGAAQTLRGGGSMVGTMINNGQITPGTSIDTLTFSTAPTLNGGGSITAEIDRNGGSPLADKLVISSGTLTFGGTLTLTNIGGTLQAGDTFDLFDGSLSGTFATLNLPGGTGHWNTGDLNSGGTITFSGNAAPVATNLTLGCALGDSVSFGVIGGKHAPTDADGDTMTVTAAGPASSGTSGFTANNVTYTADGTMGTHTFTYTVTDALGATDTKTVTVIVSAAEGFNKLSGPTGTGPYSFSYLGIPNEDYALQETSDLPATGSSIWTSVVTNTASGTGALEFNGVTLSHPAGSFRTRHVAP